MLLHIEVGRKTITPSPSISPIPVSGPFAVLTDDMHYAVTKLYINHLNASHHLL